MKNTPIKKYIVQNNLKFVKIVNNKCINENI